VTSEPIGAALNRNVGSPTAPGEGVEGQIDAFIAQREKERIRAEGDRRAEEAWKESSQRQERARRNALAWEWLRFYLAKIERRERTKAVQDAEDQREIRRYRKMLGMDPEWDGTPYEAAS